MGDSPSAPAPQPAPPPPNYAAANREAVQADIDTLGTRRRIEQAAKIGTSVYDPDTGKTYDFTGLGDAELGKSQAKIDAETADMQAQSMLDVGAKYGPQFEDQAIEALKRSDPTRFDINAKLGASIQDQLAHINDIDPQVLKDAEADIRGRQYAMGNTRGNAPTANEILAKYDVRNRMKQQTLGNVSQYLAGTPISSQFASISGAQQGAAPYNPVNFQPGTSLNANAGAMGTNFAMQSYGQQSANVNAANQYGLSAWQTTANKPNPWLSAAGTVAGAAATAF